MALFALGYSDTPHTKEALLPFLTSADPQERWASALALGERREEPALPVLIALLDEFLSPRSHPLERERGLYHSWRLKVVSLLGEWERDELAPALRSALEKSWKIEQVEQIAHKQVWLLPG